MKMNSYPAIATLVAIITLALLVPFSFASENTMTDNLMRGDRNGDGVLTEDEVPAGMFSLFDADGNGRVDRAELQALAKRMGTSKPFSWVNPPEPDVDLPGLRHATFTSSSMDTPVGYNIYLPSGYEQAAEHGKRYPVLYYLHGGRPGSESRSIALAEPIHEAITAGEVRPMIVVWVNGGEISHYNYQDSKGEDVFIKELIPHIDRTYRTIDQRGGRAIQGFSQGGRGVTRIMFKYPYLFVSAAPGGPGYAVEKQIYENNGIEQDQRAGAPGDAAPALDFGEGNDAFSLARAYLEQQSKNPLKIMIWVGNKGFNYEATLEYLGFLYGLGIPVERLVAADVDHNPFTFYRARGLELLQFHDQHWAYRVD